MNIFIRDEKKQTPITPLISLAKVVSGGSCVCSIKTANDNNNNAINNINDQNENDIINSDNNQSGLKRIWLGTTVLTDRQESNQMEERVK